MGQQNVPATQIWTLPTVGPPTTNVLLQGVGFDPLTAIDIYFDDSVLASTTTDTNGSFGQGVITATGATWTQLQVPATALPGQHTITAQEHVGQKSAQKPFLVRTDWPQFQFSPDHTGVNPYENILSPDNVGGLGVRWSYLGIRAFTPTVAGGILYMSSRDDMSLYAFDAGTGTFLWKYGPTGYWVSSTPAVANGVVYFFSDDGSLYALNSTTGALLWSYATGFGGSSPAVAKGAVYFLSSDGYLYALNATTGELLWRYPTGGPSRSTPAVVNGVVYVGSYDHNVYALDANTGALLWKYATGDSVYSSPSVVNRVVYVGSFDHNVYALDANTGALLWKYATGDLVFPSPAVANGVVYIGSDDYNLYALNASTGELIWRYATGSWMECQPAVANGVVYFGSWDNNWYALNARTGALLWQYNIGFVGTGQVVADGVLYSGAYGRDYNQGGVYAFDLSRSSSPDKLNPPARPEPISLLPDWKLQPSPAVTSNKK